jgi:4-amino-4-deoxychorismate lyase
MTAWINGRRRSLINYRDRGLQYGDGLFETMFIRNRTIRLLDYHLDRLYASCERLMINPPKRPLLTRELRQIAARRPSGVLKLILTRGVGTRGYRPDIRAGATRIAALYARPKRSALDVRRLHRVRLCSLRLGINPRLAGLKTLNRLEFVLARAEWRDSQIAEGILLDADENIVCGTMSNIFVRRRSVLMTPPMDRCGVAGVMRRWVIDQAPSLGLRLVERQIRWVDLAAADEVFMTNALMGILSVGDIRFGRARLRVSSQESALRLNQRLDIL